MSNRTKVDIVRELPVSAIRSTVAPVTPEKHTSDLETVVDVTIESRSYRELFLVALEKLADLQKRFENSQRAMKEYRTRERARRDVHR